MDRQFLSEVISLLGFNYTGDLGGFTIYRTRRGRPVFFPVSPPKTPPSPAQTSQRNRFKLAQQAWTAESNHSDWEQATIKMGLCLTGQNLYIHWCLTSDRQLVQDEQREIENQTGIVLTPHPYIP